MLSRTKKQLSLAKWNQQLRHEICGRVGDNEWNRGQGRGRRFLSRFCSCATVLPLVVKAWVRNSPRTKSNFPKKADRKLAARQTVYSFLVQFREKKKRKEEKKAQRRWHIHTLTSSTSSTILKLPVLHRDIMPSHIPPFTQRGLRYSITLHLTAKRRAKKNKRQTREV